MEFEFERKAMSGEQLPKGLDVADSCLFLSLKNLYAMYRNNAISRKDAAQEKKRLVYNWTKDKSKIEFLEREALALNQRIKVAAQEYKNNPCQKNADNLYAAFYNLPENWRNEK